MKKIITSTIAIAGISTAAHAVLLYSDDFGTGGSTYDGSSAVKQAEIGTLTVYGSSINPRINVDRLQVDDGGPASEGLAFGGSDSRYNWATGSFASDIISDGLQIDFDARTSNGSDFWSLGFGSFTGIPSGGANSGYGAIYGYADMDWGYRAENDRAISFLADDTTNTSVIETYSVGNYNWYHVSLDLQFTDFNAGSTVTVTAIVYSGQGTEGSTVSTINDTFTLSATDTFFWDISANEAGSEVLMDNLQVASGAIPEPSAAGFIAAIALGLASRRRK